MSLSFVFPLLTYKYYSYFIIITLIYQGYHKYSNIICRMSLSLSNMLMGETESWQVFIFLCSLVALMSLPFWPLLVLVWILYIGSCIFKIIWNILNKILFRLSIFYCFCLLSITYPILSSQSSYWWFILPSNSFRENLKIINFKVPFNSKNTFLPVTWIMVWLGENFYLQSSLSLEQGHFFTAFLDPGWLTRNLVSLWFLFLCK